MTVATPAALRQRRLRERRRGCLYYCAGDAPGELIEQLIERGELSEAASHDRAKIFEALLREAERALNM